ncbi:hypothetical protein DITRI_Ditri11bG0097600 [Diplodiscus trichospermus]
MENNKTSCPEDVCEKIFRAVTFGPAFTTIRRLSSRQPTPSPLKHADAANPCVHTPTISKEGAQVPIKFDYTTRLTTPPTEKQKPTTTQNGATQTNGQVPPKRSTDMVHQPQNNPKHKAEASDGHIQVEYERHTANKEEGKKPTQHHDDFSEFIHKIRERIMLNDEDHGED